MAWIYLEYVWNIGLKIWLEYGWNMAGIWMKHGWNMGGIWLENGRNTAGLLLEYGWDKAGIWVAEQWMNIDPGADICILILATSVLSYSAACWDTEWVTPHRGVLPEGGLRPWIGVSYSIRGVIHCDRGLYSNIMFTDHGTVFSIQLWYSIRKRLQWCRFQITIE